MRIYLRHGVGAGGFLILGASLVALGSNRGAAALLFGMCALAGAFLGGYAWRVWWAAIVASGLVCLVVGVLFQRWVPAPTWVVTSAFTGLAAAFARIRPQWPLVVSHAFFTVGMLVMVSLGLSGVLAAAAHAPRPETIDDVVVLYLSTPPWEWVIAGMVLGRSVGVGPFISSRYRWNGRLALQGLFVGLGLILMTAVVVGLEASVWHVHVVANNPFVTTPGLRRHQVGAAALIALGVVLMAPIAEEVLFRGILFGTLSKHWGYWAGSLTSASIFGLAHLNLTLLVPLALAGLALNALYHQSESLIPSTVAHMTLNGLSVVMALGFSR